MIKIGPMPPNNFPPLYSIYIRIYGIKALGPSRRRLGTRRRGRLGARHRGRLEEVLVLPQSNRN